MLSVAVAIASSSSKAVIEGSQAVLGVLSISRPSCLDDEVPSISRPSGLDDEVLLILRPSCLDDEVPLILRPSCLDDEVLSLFTSFLPGRW
jgi:hypothetical protein